MIFMSILLNRWALRSGLAIVLSLSGLVAREGVVSGAVDPPRLRIEPAGKVDLGSLGPREKKLQHYTFTNTSGAPIVLRVFDLSPGVTVGGAALTQPIPARGALVLDLRVDTSDWVGFQVRNVRLGTDDPRQGTYYLPTEMMVRPDLTVDQPRREFGDVAVPGSPQEKFIFKRETGAPVVLRVAQELPPYLELEQGEGQGAASLTFTLRTLRVPPGVRLGFERIQVTTNAPLEPSFDLYLSWKLHHAIEAAPSRLVFQNADEPSLPLTLEATSGKAFRILAARVDGPGFQVAGPLPLPAARQELTIVCTAGAGARATLELTFQGEEAPLKVPLAYCP